MRPFLLEIEGRQQKVWAQKLKNQLWVHFNGQTFMVPDQELRRSSGPRGPRAGEKGQVTAPMPGKVTKILVHSGDKIQRGSALVVMEAMKMEYTLSADRDGVVQEVPCRTGDQVKLGQVLVKLNPVES